jgi:large subunit ribosomal protein L25
MKLAIHKRAAGKKGANNALRREGNIPGILYGFKQDGAPIHIRADEFQAILRKLKPGLLATTVFELHDGVKTHKALVKDIQYHVASYDVLHIDFSELVDGRPITVNVPVQVVGVSECTGVKLGGFIRQVIRALKVSCDPKHIPQEFAVDVKDLGIGQAKRLSDLTIPSNVKPLAKMEEVVVLVGKKAGT